MSSNNNNSSNDPSSEPPAGLLQMGISVGVNDETRRVIEAETKELEASCKKLIAEESQEESIAKELVKSQNRQKNEMFDMRRGARETYEYVQTKAAMLQNIKSSLHQGMRPKQENQDPNGMEENLDHVKAFREAIAVKSERAGVLAERGDDEMQLATEYQIKAEEIIGEGIRLKQTAKAEQLRTRLANAKQKTLADEDILNEEEDRLRSLQEQHTAAMDRCSNLRDEVATKTNELEKTKSDCAKKEAKAKETLVALRVKKQKEDEEVQALEQQLTELQAKRSALAKSLEQGKDLIAKRQEQEAKRVSIVSEIRSVFEETTKVEATLETQKKKLEAEKQKLGEVNAKKDAVTLLKAKNDEKDSENLATKMASKQAAIEAHKKELETANDELDSTLKTLEEELAEEKKKAADYQVQIHELTGKHKELKTEVENYSKEIGKESDSFEEKCSRMKSKVREEEETNAACEENIEKHLKKGKPTTQGEHNEAMRKYKVLKHVAKKLSAAKKAEIALAAAKSKE